LCALLKESDLLDTLEEKDGTFTLFAPTDDAFKKMEDLAGFRDEEVKDILKLHILNSIETFDSLDCLGSVTTLLGEKTETLCLLGVTNKFQVGKGNIDDANVPEILPPFFLGSNGNILPVDNVILPELPTIGKFNSHRIAYSIVPVYVYIYIYIYI